MEQKKSISYDELMDKYQEIVKLLEDEYSYLKDNEPIHLNKNQQSNDANTFFYETFKNLLFELNHKSESESELESESFLLNVVNKYEKSFLLFCKSNKDQTNSESTNSESTYNIIPQGFAEYVTKLNDNLTQNKTVCEKFISCSDSSADQTKENIELGHVISFYICDKCDYPYSSHTTCSKFVYKKNPSTKKLENICENCNMIHYDHILTKNVFSCENFNDNNFGYCNTCDHHITEHVYNNLYHKLKQNIKSKITENLLCIKIEAIRSPLFRLLVNDINNRIYVENYIKLYEKQNKNGYHDIISSN